MRSGKEFTRRFINLQGLVILAIGVVALLAFASKAVGALLVVAGVGILWTNHHFGQRWYR